ncbi:sterol desaturase family protein [Pseudoalteromonas sp. A757]|uniref:sterol desaturase family protein n=1 Tax=Pseudoalteromonas sp. A757 TaxID=2250709 RepID=UPI000FFEA31E|nr:sterol desaturase family protein [Pseudoalteromonas sp. A757]RXE88638.1 sterol desaturase family protein [Pseudoalteromonas sp. A757]
MVDVSLILLALSPIFLLCVAWEYIKHHEHYDWRDSILNALLALLHQGSDALALLVLMPLFYWLHQFALFTIELNLLTLLFGFILQDFLYYWFHRASHCIHWLWSAHVVHHSSNNMNFTTAFRQSLLYPIVGMWLFWLPMILLGFTPTLVFAIVAINLAFQFFVHTQTVNRLGVVERIFNTPSHHRVHHASNPDYIDKNFAGVLIIWDKLFGTFVEEREDITICYGIRGAAPKQTPLDVNFAQWRHMFHCFSQANTLKNKWLALFGYPTHLPEKPKNTASVKP